MRLGKIARCKENLIKYKVEEGEDLLLMAVSRGRDDSSAVSRSREVPKRRIFRDPSCMAFNKYASMHHG